jgi:acetyl-CoA synthetase
MRDLPVIKKQRREGGVQPNLQHYDETYASFSWRDLAQELTRGHADVGADSSLNIASIALDQNLSDGRGEQVAVRWLAAEGDIIRDFTFAQLAEFSARFANVLRGLGVCASDVVCTVLGRIPELYTVCFGTLKNRSILCPLFTAFGPEPLRMRLDLSRAKVLVTSRNLYERKIAPMRSSLSHLSHVILIDVYQEQILLEGTQSYGLLMAHASPVFHIPPTRPEDPALLHFTSGTTGTPKGALHVHQSVMVHYATAKYVLDLRPGDVYWCTADPGWVTGTSYGIIAPLTVGVTLVVDEAEFDAARWYKILQDQKVNVWYTAPTAVRMLMKSGEALPQSYDLSHLRHAVSVGEPLNPEAVLWSQRVLGRPIHDTWWQTETGGIMVANFPVMDIKPGSMGRPVPGVEAAIVSVVNGVLQPITEPNVEGELALRVGWPSMFRSYLNQDERYKKCFIGGYYLTGDLARRDADGYFWFVGRADDVIKSAGHLIGPFEVESVLIEHPAVAEAAVIGKPDPLLMEVVKAFVALKSGFSPDEATRKDIIALARRRLGPAVAPREIEFVADLPKTKSGKIMRRLLKARELGLPEGDTSTLERPSAVTDLALQSGQGVATGGSR